MVHDGAVSFQVCLLIASMVVATSCVRGFESSAPADANAAGDLDSTPAAADLDARAARDLDSGFADLFVLPDTGPLADLGFSCTCTKADFNHDGQVDLDDWQIFTDCYGKKPEGECSAVDLSGDGVIGLNDFGCFKKMHTSC